MIVERPGLEGRVLASLDAGRIPVLLGGCAIGRTSLLLRVQELLGRERAQYLDFGAAATTPERCLAAVRQTSGIRPLAGGPVVPPTSARGAFDAMMAFLDQAVGSDGAPATFLIDELLDIRTFENFPGLRQVQRDVVARLAGSQARFVVASRFTMRAHRLLRDAPARFEVMHVPGLNTAEVQALARRFDGGRRDGATPHADVIAVLTGGRAGYAHLLIEALSSMGPADPIAALASLFAPEGRLTARCRESYEFRLHRARGYGALKAILGILADNEPQNLTEIAQHLQRTPGSTKDYLSWLEDVDLVVMQGKRYSYTDPLVRLYVRLYARPVPPSDADIVREVRAYAQSRMPMVAAPVAGAAVLADRGLDSDRASGIIEID